MQIQYIADDGAKFNFESDCLEYEEKLRSEHHKALLAGAKELDLTLWKKYFPDDKSELEEPELALAFVWLENDISEIVLRNNMKPSLSNIKNEILAAENGSEILSKLSWEKIENTVTIKSDWVAAFGSTKAGSDLAHPLGYTLSGIDLKELAALHKANKYRKKIESLLTCMNFHAACQDFVYGSYAKYNR